MGEYSVVAEVGETLVEVLRDRMDDLIDTDSDVALVSPADLKKQPDVRLSVYLYQVTESSHLKNREREVIDPETVRDPPLALDLYYLLTAYPSKGNGNQTENAIDQHTVLGRAMQVLYEDAVLRGSTLEGSLAGDAELRVSLDGQSSEEVVSIWNTFGERPYRPSVSYLVSPVLVESTPEEIGERVRERTLSEYRIAGEVDHE